MTTLAEADVLDLLASLVDKSLVVREEQADGRARYRLLKTVRQFGGNALDNDEALRDRHLRYYTALVEAARPHAMRGMERNELVTFARDHANFEVALSSGQADGRRVRLRLALALEAYWMQRGFLHSGWSHVRSNLDPAPPHATRLDALGYVIAASMAGELWELEEARRLAEQALSMFREVADRAQCSRTLSLLASTASKGGDAAAADAFADEAMRLADEVGDEHLRAEATWERGLIRLVRGDAVEAEPLLRAVLARRRETGEHLGGSLTVLAWCLHEKGDLAEARRTCEVAIEERTRYDYATGLAWSRVLLVQISLDADAIDDLARPLMAALDFFLETGNRLGMTQAVHAAADLLHRIERSERAAALLAASEPKGPGLTAAYLRRLEALRDRVRAAANTPETSPESLGEAAVAARTWLQEPSP